MKSFPVADKLWTILSSFFKTLKQSCLSTLQRESLTPDVAAKCLASIYLLISYPPERLLPAIVQHRSKAFKEILSEDTSNQHLRVKDRILTSVRLLIDTIDLIYKCFVDAGDSSGRGLLMSELLNLKRDDAKPTISLIPNENPMMIALLPDIISKFVPNFEIPTWTEENFEHSMKYWLDFTAHDTSEQLKILISAVASIKTIHFIKMEATAIGKKREFHKHSYFF